MSKRAADNLTPLLDALRMQLQLRGFDIEGLVIRTGTEHDPFAGRNVTHYQVARKGPSGKIDGPDVEIVWWPGWHSATKLGDMLNGAIQVLASLSTPAPAKR